jgi:hypothetical protein
LGAAALAAGGVHRARRARHGHLGLRGVARTRPRPRRLGTGRSVHPAAARPAGARPLGDAVRGAPHGAARGCSATSRSCAAAAMPAGRAPPSSTRRSAPPRAFSRSPNR